MKLLKRPHSPRRVVIQCTAAVLVLAFLLVTAAYAGVKSVRETPEYTTKAGILRINSVVVSHAGKGYIILRQEYQNPFFKNFKDIEYASMQLAANASKVSAVAKIGAATYLGDSTSYKVFYGGQNGAFYTYYTVALQGDIPTDAQEITVDIEGMGEKTLPLFRLDTQQASQKVWQLPDGQVTTQFYPLTPERDEILVRCVSSNPQKLHSPGIDLVQMGGEDNSLQSVQELPIEISPEETLVLYRREKKRESLSMFERTPKINDLLYQGLTFSYYPTSAVKLEFPVPTEKEIPVLFEDQKIEFSPELRAPLVGMIKQTSNDMWLLLDIPQVSDYLKVWEFECNIPNVSEDRSVTKLGGISTDMSEYPIICPISSDQETFSCEIVRLSYFYPVIGWAFGQGE